MALCYLCLENITDSNRTIEHIIPSCIDGRLTSDLLICSKCNNDSGTSIDAELCYTLNPISLYYQRTGKQRSPNSLVVNSSTGEKVLLSPTHLNASGWTIRNLDPTHGIDAEGNKTLSAGTEKRAKQELDKIRKSLINGEKIEIISTRAEFTQASASEPVRFTLYDFDDNLLLRSACKVAANYFVHSKYDAELINKLRMFILDGSIENLYSWVLQLNISKQLFPGKVYHLISLNVDQKQRVLYAYLEFYSAVGFVILLNSNYKGEKIESTYLFDVLTKQEVYVNVPVIISGSDIINHILQKPKDIIVELVYLKTTGTQ